MTKFKSVALNAAKVGGHILVSILLVGGLAYVQGHVAFFTSYLVSFGVPVAVVNIIIAAVIKYLSAHQPTDTTIDSLPNNAQIGK